MSYNNIDPELSYLISQTDTHRPGVNNTLNRVASGIGSTSKDVKEAIARVLSLSPGRNPLTRYSGRTLWRTLGEGRIKDSVAIEISFCADEHENEDEAICDSLILDIYKSTAKVLNKLTGNMNEIDTVVVIENSIEEEEEDED